MDVCRITCSLTLFLCLVQVTVCQQCKNSWRAYRQEGDGFSLACLYHHNATKSTWMEASEVCRRRGGQIAPFIQRYYTSRFSSRKTVNFGRESFWTGLHNYKGRLYWNGIPPYRPAGINSPFSTSGTFWTNFLQTGDCTTGSDNNEYIDIKFSDCLEKHTFYCDMDPIVIKLSSGGCPNGYFGNEKLDNCYKFTNIPKIYREAQATCIEEGGTLAKFRLNDIETFTVGDEWDSAVADKVYIDLNNRTRAWFDRTGRLDASECNILVLGETMGGLVRDCQQKFPFICMTSRPPRVQKPLNLNIEFTYPNMYPVQQSPMTPGIITCRFSRKLENYEQARIYKDGLEVSPQLYQYSNNRLSVSIRIMVPSPETDNLNNWQRASGDMATYRCDVYSNDIGIVSNASTFTNLSHTDVMVFMASVKVSDAFKINDVVKINLEKDFSAANAKILRDFSVWIRNMKNYVGYLIRNDAGGINLFGDIYAVGKEGITLHFNVNFVPGKRFWSTNEKVAEVQGLLQEAAEITMNLGPLDKKKRRRRQSSDVATTTNVFVAGSVTLQSSQLCTRQYIQELGQEIKFNPTLPGFKVTSVEACITDLKPLVTGYCRAYRTSVIIDRIYVNPKCVFQSIPDIQEDSIKQVTSDLKKLSEATINETNVPTIMKDLANLTSETNNLTSIGVIYSATVLRNADKLSSVSTQVLNDVVKSVNNIQAVPSKDLQNAQEYGSALNRILQSFEGISAKAKLMNDMYQSVSDKFALSIHSFDSNDDIVVGLQLDDSDKELNGITNGTLEVIRPDSMFSPENLNTAIILPAELVKDKSVRLVLQIFADTGLFYTRKMNRKYQPNGQIAAATLLVDNSSMTDLGKYRVKSYFKPLKMSNETVCGYWNYSINDQSGGWSSDGCTLTTVQNGRYVCECDHLTNFAILVDAVGQTEPIDPGNTLALTIITIIGLTLSIIGLGLTVLSFILIKQMRKGRGQQTLFNLALAMLFSMIVFLAGIKQTSDHIGCIAVAALLHYFILVSFAWMLVEGFLQYLRFVKVLGTYIPNFMMKAAIPAWGIPLIPVIVVLSIDFNMYRGGELYCWMHPMPFYYAFLLPVCLIIVTNIIVFIIVLKNLLVRPKGLQSNQSERKRAMVHLRAAISIVVLLGLTWVFGFLAIEDARLPFLYLFTIFNAFQGFFIFIFFIAREKGFVEGFRKLCCKTDTTKKYLPASSNDSNGNQTSKNTNSSSL